MNFGPTVRHLNIDQIQNFFYSGEPVEWIRDYRGSCYSLILPCDPLRWSSLTGTCFVWNMAEEFKGKIL